MSWIVAAVVAVPLGLAALYLRSRAKYYQRMFGQAHLRELHERFVTAVEALSPTATESSSDSRSFLTSAGLGVVVTRDPGSMHVSFSQQGGPTTMEVASRMGFLLLATLRDDEIEVTPFYTQSRIFHLIIRHPDPSLVLAPFEQALADYHDYQPVPYRYEPISADPDASPER